MQLYPATLGAAAPDPSRSPDRLSARWLIAVAARTVREVGELVAGATRAGKRLATFTLDGEVRFASAADRAAFAEELATAVTTLVGRYHDDNAPGGRSHRIVLTVHPHIEHIEREERSCPAS
jgi:hypothetical protein